MQVEDFLDFREPEYTQIKGTRVGIETVLGLYLKGESAEQIFKTYEGGIPLEGIYATILYYLADREKVGKYIQDIWDWSEARWQEQQNNPTPGMLRLKKLYDEAQASGLPLSDPNNPVWKAKVQS